MRARRIAANIATTRPIHPLRNPNSPVCRQDGAKLFIAHGVHPTTDRTSARKRESVFAVAVDNREFHITVERSAIYWLPFHFHSPAKYGYLRQANTNMAKLGIDINQTGDERRCFHLPRATAL